MERIFIHDVVARDGLQIEPAWMPTERKIELIDRLSADRRGQDRGDVLRVAEGGAEPSRRRSCHGRHSTAIPR